MSDLFRKEAVTHATRRLAGEVVLASSVSSRVLAGLLIAVVLGGAAFAATASYARKETVVGWLTPQAGMIRLAARQGGIVSTVHVREGDTVTVGQPIATLTLSSALEGGDTLTALSRSLDVQGEAADGQKQRVLLARALYRQPRILILDEGTANLDVQTEEVIADLIAQLPITRIVVAHRPALLQRADRVLVVESGALSAAKVERPIAEREVAQA